MLYQAEPELLSARYMNKDDLQKYLDTRRMGWPYGDSYRVENRGDHRFVAMIGDELAGLSYAEISEEEDPDENRMVRSARMRMNLKSEFAEFGIGTELLELLMEDLQETGCDIIRYEIPLWRYAVQIYRNLGFEVESRDEELVRFIWRR